MSEGLVLGLLLLLSAAALAGLAIARHCRRTPRLELRLRLRLHAGDRVPCEACRAMVCVTYETRIFEGERLLCCGCAGAAQRRGWNRE